MSIFENLENLNVSEKCFNDIMGIVEEVINELRDNTVDACTQKRLKNRAEAFYDYMENPSDENWKNYKKAEAKSVKNTGLSINRDNRHGVINTVKSGRISKEVIDKNPEKYKNVDTAHVQMFQNALNKTEDERK